MDTNHINCIDVVKFFLDYGISIHDPYALDQSFSDLGFDSLDMVHVANTFGVNATGEMKLGEYLTKVGFDPHYIGLI